MEGVQVFPSELKFPFELGKELTATMTLHNSGSQRLVFKVLTTNPDKYCVRPCMGVLEPAACLEATVAMQAYTEIPTDLADCQDRFLVQSRSAGAGSGEEVNEGTFPPGVGGCLRETCLPVWLELPNGDDPLMLDLALHAGGGLRDEIADVFDEDLDEWDDDGRQGFGETGEDVRQFFTANAEFASVAKDVLMDHLDKIMRERDFLRSQVLDTSPRGGRGYLEEKGWAPAPRRGGWLGAGWSMAVAVVGSFVLGRLTA